MLGASDDWGGERIVEGRVRRRLGALVGRQRGDVADERIATVMIGAGCTKKTLPSFCWNTSGPPPDGSGNA